LARFDAIEQTYDRPLERSFARHRGALRDYGTDGGLLLASKPLSMERNSSSASNQTLKVLQSIYFAYDVGIISSAKCTKYK